MKRFYRPVDLGRAAGVSAQTVRKYERFRFLPPAERGPTGNRRYTERHLRALRVARAAIAGYGWQPALHVMQLVHEGQVAKAHAAVDAAHAALHHERQSLEQMLTALRAATATLAPTAKPEQHLSGLLVGEAARRVGVRVSAVRFWEAQGLLLPERDRTSRYRRYDDEQFRHLQLVALLRRAGYDIGAIRAILDQLRSGRPGQAVQAAERRLAELTELSRRRMAATAALWVYLESTTKAEWAEAAAASPDAAVSR